MANNLTRRSIISGAAKGLLGVSVASAFSGSANGMIRSGKELDIALTGGKAKSVIYIFLTGGMSQIDSFDPKPGKETQGPVEAIGTNVDGVQITEYFPSMAKQMDKVCLVRSMNSNLGAHEQGCYFMRTSYETTQTITHPGLGAWGSHFLGQGQSRLPGNIKIGGGNSASFWGGFLDPYHAALPILNPSAGLPNVHRTKGLPSSRFQRRVERLRAMNAKFANSHSTRQTRAHVQLFDEAVRLMKTEDIEGFDLTRETPQQRARYGENSLGQGCLLAKRLVQRGVRFIEVNGRGWDTHMRNFVRMEEKGAILDQALSSLLADLDAAGTLEETLVVVATEFGRTPMIDGPNVGRDHYPKAFTCLLAGGGISGGQVYGATDEMGHEVTEDMVSIPDFNATIGYAMGLPLDQKVISPTNRPFTVANKGKPVTSLFG